MIFMRQCFNSCLCILIYLQHLFDLAWLDTVFAPISLPFFKKQSIQHFDNEFRFHHFSAVIQRGILWGLWWFKSGLSSVLHSGYLWKAICCTTVASGSTSMQAIPVG